MSPVYIAGGRRFGSEPEGTQTAMVKHFVHTDNPGKHSRIPCITNSHLQSVKAKSLTKILTDTPIDMTSPLTNQ